jgi:hypothetical protein
MFLLSDNVSSGDDSLFFFRDMAIAKNTPEKPGKYGN